MKWETHKPETNVEARQFLREFFGVCEFYPHGYRYWATFTVGGRSFKKLHDFADEFSVVDVTVADTVSARSLWEQWQVERRKLQGSRSPGAKGPQPFTQSKLSKSA